jgi:phosphoglucosamine mutase
MSQVRDHVVAAYDDITTIDGVRIGFDDGWVLIRASGTQPLIRLTAEARDPDRADDLLDTARSVVSRAEA